MTFVKRMAPLFIASLILITSCQRDRETAVCVSGMGNLAPTDAASIEINAGKITTFHADPLVCDPTKNYGIRWVLDDEIVAYANDYDYIACNEDEGLHQLSAQAITYTTTDEATLEEVVFEHTWAIQVNGVSRPQKPGCFQQSISDVQSVSVIDKDSSLYGPVYEEQISKLQDAVSCLDEYLETYACDFPAAYASGLAKSALFADNLYPRFRDRQNMTLADVEDIVYNEVEPIRKNFLVVEEKAPDDFSFNVSGLFKLKFFSKDDTIPWSTNGYIQLGGRHDKSEAIFILTFMSVFNGALNIGLANNGAIELAIHTPDEETPVSASRRIIEYLEGDPEFLTFKDEVDENGELTTDGDGKEGRRLMGNAQNNFIQATVMASGLFDRVRSETHDQAQDVFRYWDCGKDAICPASCSYSVEMFNADGEPDDAENSSNCTDENQGFSDRNLNNKCDPSWETVGKDEGECNKKYDEGEIIGLQRLSWSETGTPNRDGPSLEIDKIQAILGLVKENLRGPDFLDLDEIADILDFGSSASLAMQAVGIPYPKIRLSEFFLTPTPIRGLVPLYSRSEKQFILDLESEPFDDFGYDKVASVNEEGYHETDNPDPNRDDFDPYCNPECNQDDYIDTNGNGIRDAGEEFVDNDGDGLANGADRQSGIPKDFGVEGNFIFDFIDLPDADGDFNGVHDKGEPSERFRDIGTKDITGKLIGENNGVWDWADRAHEWPTGSDVGPVANLDREPDPANGTLLEEPDGLQDTYYYFMQDPNFSGAVEFVANPNRPQDKIENIQGVELTDNAKLQRFFSVILKLAADIGVRENNAHPCSNATIERCNHWTDPSQGYQP